MDEKEFLKFVEEIAKNNDIMGVQKTFVQFAAILDKNGCDKTWVDKLLQISQLTTEIYELKKYCLDRELDMYELNQTIARAKARKEREERESYSRC